jgi:hypothetical protein
LGQILKLRANALPFDQEKLCSLSVPKLNLPKSRGKKENRLEKGSTFRALQTRGLQSSSHRLFFGVLGGKKNPCQFV